MRLLFRVILSSLCVISTTARNKGGDKCPYDVIIDGKAIRGDGTECFESPTAQGGVLAFVAGGEVDAIVVWDPDAPCPDGGSYVHYAAAGSADKADVEPMTAGAGGTVHAYRAAVFVDGLPLTEGGTGCQAFDTTDDPVDHGDDVRCLKTWRVARYGSSCPNDPPPSSSRGGGGTAWFTLFLLVAGVGGGVAAYWRRKRFLARPKVESYIALSTMSK